MTTLIHACQTKPLQTSQSTKQVMHSELAMHFKLVM